MSETSSKKELDLPVPEPEPQRKEVRTTAAPTIDGNGGAAAGAATDAPPFARRVEGSSRSLGCCPQGGFVDEPRQAVEQADALVAGAMKRLAEIFAEERARLDGQWDQDD